MNNRYQVILLLDPVMQGLPRYIYLNLFSFPSWRRLGTSSKGPTHHHHHQFEIAGTSINQMSISDTNKTIGNVSIIPSSTSRLCKPKASSRLRRCLSPCTGSHNLWNECPSLKNADATNSVCISYNITLRYTHPIACHKSSRKCRIVLCSNSGTRLSCLIINNNCSNTRLYNNCSNETLLSC